jgi:hypothetical protein
LNFSTANTDEPAYATAQVKQLDDALMTILILSGKKRSLAAITWAMLD